MFKNFFDKKNCLILITHIYANLFWVKMVSQYFLSYRNSLPMILVIDNI